MRPANKILTIVFSIAIIVMYSILAFVQINIIRSDLYKAMSDSTAYSAHQIASIVQKRINEDYQEIKPLFSDERVISITCEELNCSDRRLVELKKVLNEQMDQNSISMMGLININENVLSIFNSLSVEDNSFLRYELDYNEIFFETEIHLITLSEIIQFTSNPPANSPLSRGMILYLHKYSDNEYQFITRTNNYLDTFFTSLPLENERKIYLIGYNQSYTGTSAEQYNGKVYYSDAGDSINNFFEEIEKSNGQVSLNNFIKNVDNLKVGTFKLGNISTLICVERFLDNSYFIYTTSLSQLNSTVSNLELSATIIGIINFVLLSF